MKLSIFTPEKTLVKEQAVKEVLVPSVRGYLGILPNHAPLVSLLTAGILKYWPEKSLEEKKLALGWGYLEVHHGDVRVLAESVETKESLDRSRAEKNLKEILKKLKEPYLEPSKRDKLEKEKLRLVGELEL